MRHFIVCILLFLLSTTSSVSQNYSDFWNEYFSYYNIKDVVEGDGKLYAAGEYTVFVYDPLTQQIEEITTLDGLLGQDITTLHYSEVYGLLLIGYSDGAIQVVKESNLEVITVVDILNKPTIPPNRKKINHFNEFGNVVYIAAEYGISVYNLEGLEFGDTYYIGNFGTQIAVKQTAVFNNHIYAACYDNVGIKKAALSNPNLIDYQQWNTLVTGNFIGIESHQDQLFAIRDNRVIYEVSPTDVLTQRFQYATPPLDLKSNGEYLTVTTVNDAYVYQEDFTLLVTHNKNNTSSVSGFTSGFSTQDRTYIGTSDRGVISISNTSPTEFEELRPDGPLRNKVFALKSYANELWTVFGGYSLTFNFSGGITRSGISQLKDDTWNNISFDSIASQITNPYYLSDVSIDPFNPSKVYVSSYYSGLIEIENEEISTIYNQSNSTIVPFASTLHLMLSTTYDRNGTLWGMNGRVSHPLNKFSNGNWTSFDFSSVITNPTQELGFKPIVADELGNIWIGSYRNGLIGFNENNGSPQVKNLNTIEQNLPSSFVTALAVDKRNQLWVGTLSGLRVLYNTAGFFTDDNPELASIIIVEEDDDVPAELLFQQFISCIEVDGSNNKWVGTNTGLYYFTPDGQETIHYFTTDNSPLPSNSILDLSLDQNTGILYIATDKGLMSYASGASGTKDDLSSAFVYPNPVRPTFNITEEKVKIKDISENVNIKITDIEGNLVAEAQSRTNLRYKGYNLEIDGGIAYWNGRNLGNNVVASGVYLIMLTDLDSLETKVLKVMVVR